MAIFLSILMLLCGGSLFALSGDVNYDGQLNAADLVRLQAMIPAETGLPNPPAPLAYDVAADLDFDGAITAADEALLLRALQGEALPQVAARGKVTSEGGEAVSPELGVRLSLPAGKINGSGVVTLASLPPQFTQECGVETTHPVLISGIPVAEEVRLEFDLPANAPANAACCLKVGDYSEARSAGCSAWHFQILDPGDDAVEIKNGKLIWRPSFNLPPQSRAPKFERVNLICSIETRVLTGAVVAYRSDNFRLQADDMSLLGNTQEQQQLKAERILGDCETAYNIIQDYLGFPLDTRTTKWNSARFIEILVKQPAKDEPSNAAYCIQPGWWSAPRLELNKGIVNAANLGSTLCHELFHYAQYLYANNRSTVALDEMSAIWAESLFSHNPQKYLPGDSLVEANPRAALNGLARTYSFFRDTKAGEHGYGASAFAYYLGNRSDFNPLFWQKVFSSSDYAAGRMIYALQAGRRACAGMLPLDDLYNRFVEHYVTAGAADIDARPVFDGKIKPLDIFWKKDADDDTWDKYSKTAYSTDIMRPEQLAEAKGAALEHTFQVQSMGAATWLLTIFKKALLEHPGTTLRVEASAPCAMLCGAILAPGRVVDVINLDKVLYDDTNRSFCFELDLDNYIPSSGSLNIGIAATRNDSHNGDSETTVPLTMKVEFLGDLILPPTRTCFRYFNTLFADATVDFTMHSAERGVFGSSAVVMMEPAVGSFPFMTAQLRKPCPETILLESGVNFKDLGSVTYHDGVRERTSTPAFTGNVRINVDYCRNNQPIGTGEEYIFTAEALQNGIELPLHPENPATDTVNILAFAQNEGMPLSDMTLFAVALQPPPATPAE